jgi:hypothetical protein
MTNLVYNSGLPLIKYTTFNAHAVFRRRIRKREMIVCKLPPANSPSDFPGDGERLMSANDLTRIVSASVVPVVIISACGLLALAFYNRLAAIVSRLRGFQRERIHEQEFLQDIAEEKKDSAATQIKKRHDRKAWRRVASSGYFVLERQPGAV